MKAYINHISYYLPEEKFTNLDIETLFPEWNSEKIISKIGIKTRHIVSQDQLVSDIATNAINKLCNETNIDKSKIDYLILCTQSPDYLLPTTACIVQEKAGLSTSCAAIDINQGCSGYIYGLTLAKGLIISEIAKKVIFVTAETYSRYIHTQDKGNRSIFGDAATATLITNNGLYEIGQFELGTDGRGKENLIHGGRRFKNDEKEQDQFNANNFLFMNGPEIFKFSANVIPNLITQTLKKNNGSLQSIDQFIFHQANTYMLTYLRKKINISEEKFIIDMEDYGNTVSSTIPIVLANLIKANKNKNTILIAGFGVGYSWGATCLEKR
ncbi:ketoacyl-ACP synthase III [Apibacter muscae]|uniref:3-oxoacyl-ACP synthase III family protein n=1 Tax=Apibacter muscae TaxID=2509004 RepID=UPI0011ACE961|nr:ketoacyl-ACP synthase III [Apibacter muscae]TWP25138.1 ketoacyl-ACP synthase III [Apibacter muscae]